jgi:hypothetical protein
MAKKPKWTPPADYKPMPGLATYLVNLSPRMNTPEMDMVIYWQWVHRMPKRYRRSPQEAWDDLRMTIENARSAIDKTIVPMEIYPQALQRATSTLAAVLKQFKRRKKST